MKFIIDKGFIGDKDVGQRSQGLKLDRDVIIDAALTLLNEVGIDALSTRALAQRLGVQQPALYWHFKNKRALLDAMNTALLRRYDSCDAPLPGETWQAFFRRNTCEFRKALLSVRDGARLHAGTEAEPEDVEKIAVMMDFMTGQGLRPADIMTLGMAASRYTIGCVMEEQAEAPDTGRVEALDSHAQAYPAIAEAIAHYRLTAAEVHFLAGLDLLIAGFAAKHTRP
ncbi:TetR/AcrR family transcriptional regulator C-terminal domain-containing protein [Asticcacaulis solisilvae]|uniref:TetR/AcrR family transcriptional regulator C-terminal domain-containing protein n=1 Tax=Asticcacaulis solisilvae TaxID=1217274 RepID=UPI003FD6C4F6